MSSEADRESSGLAPAERGSQEARLEVYAPEGLALGFRLAEIGDRANAFLLDALLVALGVGLFVLAALTLGGVGVAMFSTAFRADEVGYLLSFVMLGLFLIWNFYFTFFELRWQGQTPGKRRFKLRVIDANGGALTVEAIFARNLTRDIEIVFPLLLLLSPAQVFAGNPAWAQALALLWVLALLLFPALNPKRRRIGDFIGGTVVVALPERKLLADLTSRERTRLTETAPQKPVFTPAQLDVYGIYELQTLEQVLRDLHKPGAAESLRIVARAVRTKIAWPNGDPVDDLTFLETFYAAQRGRLEQKLVLGERRERKRGRHSAP